MKKGLRLTRDEIKRKKGRSWKEGEWRRESGERRLGLVVTHSRFIISVIINVIVFFLFINFLKFFQYYHQLLQQSIFQAYEGFFWSDVQNTSTTE